MRISDWSSDVCSSDLLSISGATGKGIETLVRVAFEQRDIWTRRVSTAKLNRWFEGAVTANPPPAPGGKRIKLRYMTQARTRPPDFVHFGTPKIGRALCRESVVTVVENTVVSGCI